MIVPFARWRRVTLALALTGAVSALMPRALAEEREVREHDHDRAQRARESGEIRPLEEIMAVVRERFPGEVAQIDLERERGVWLYEFKVIDRTGRLLEIKIDAATGRVAEVEDD